VTENGHHIVVFSELDENPGPSITNSIETAIDRAMKLYELAPGRTTFLEHYPVGVSGRDSHTFDLVQVGTGGPHWRRLPGELAVKVILGEEFLRAVLSPFSAGPIE
jgi:hypothetical protein